MDQVIELLINFREKEIFVEEIVDKTGASLEQIQSLFEDYRNTPECLEKYLPKWKYINKETGLVDNSFGAHIRWDENRKEIVSLINSHFVNESRELDLFLSHKMFGYTPRYGSTYCDHLDGERAAWVSHSDFEVPFYTKNANELDNLLAQLNSKEVMIHHKGLYKVEIESLVSAEAPTLALAVSKALESYFRHPLRPSFWIVQESSTEEFFDPRCVSSLCRSLDEVEQVLKEKQENGYFYRIKELV